LVTPVTRVGDIPRSRQPDFQGNWLPKKSQIAAGFVQTASLGAVGSVDVVVVSYNSRGYLRACVEPLSKLDGVHVIVVDNASADGSLEALAGLPVVTIQRETNGGFAVGCNEGSRAGAAQFVLFLNPDAAIEGESLQRLVEVMSSDEHVGLAAPRIEHLDGSLAYSLRRFPRLRSTFSQALFLHRLAPHADWADETIRDARWYARPWSPEWVSGACMLVRRSALEAVGGWDEGFFLFGEDVDLCARLRAEGLSVSFVPDACVRHREGASAPSGVTLPLLAAARVHYSRKHHRPLVAALDRAGVALGAATRGRWCFRL
jgi:GT2 family glycosyltransferase